MTSAQQKSARMNHRRAAFNRMFHYLRVTGYLHDKNTQKLKPSIHLFSKAIGQPIPIGMNSVDWVVSLYHSKALALFRPDYRSQKSRRILSLAEKAALPKKQLSGYRKWLNGPSDRKEVVIKVPTKLEVYTAYINSPAWRRKRQEVFVYYGKECGVCGSKHFLEVHHISYANLGSEPLSDLMVLCRTCHKRAHNKKTTSL